VEAIDEMLQGFLERARSALDTLKPEDAASFPERRLKVERELSGGHGVMGVFQHMLEQRDQDSPYRDALDAADLICAGCYLLCIQKAQAWQALPVNQPFRAPPLTYLNAALSPTAATRRHMMGLFGMPGEGLTEIKMPISVLSLPFDHTSAIWTYCALYHEIGHPLDQDLQIAEALENHVRGVVDAARWPQWRWWLREIIADAFGGMLGGVAYARSLARLLIRAPADVLRLEPEDRHPNAYVRLFLVTSMLRVFAGQVQAMAATADELENMWRTRYAETPELTEYREECADVAAAVLRTPLNALNGHAMQEFGTGMLFDHNIMNQLARWIHIGGPQPDTAVYEARHTAGAAQIAVSLAVADAIARGTTPQAAIFDQIHARGIELVKAIPRPDLLAGPGDAVARKRYFRSLTMAINFDGI
jgi:hypothetical protein